MPFVFQLLINEKYNKAYNQVPILMLAVLFQVIVGLYSVIYVALKKSTEIAKTSFWAAVINIGVDVLLIKFIGLYAASISTLIAYAIMTIYRYFHIRKYIVIPLENKFRYLVIAIIVCVSYYLNNFILDIVTAIVVTIYAIISNREIICDTLKMILQKSKLVRK